MIDDHIICPYQETETFSFTRCISCKNYQVTIGGKNPAPHCRYQKTKKNKVGFEGAALLSRLGMPFHVVVDSTK